MTKGWKQESARHALASKGIKTSLPEYKGTPIYVEPVDYAQWEGTKYKIKGKLFRTPKKVKIVIGGVGGRAFGTRTLYVDNQEKTFLKFDNQWWKFPEEVEY